MQQITFHLRLDGASGSLVDSYNATVTRIPTLVLGLAANLRIGLFDGEAAERLSGDALPSIGSWNFAIDRDYDQSTSVLFRQTTGIGFDAEGFLCIAIPCVSSEPLVSALGSSESVVFRSELAGYQAGETIPSLVIQFDLCIRNRIDLEGGAATVPVESPTLTAAQVRAIVAEGVSALQSTVSDLQESASAIPALQYAVTALQSTVSALQTAVSAIPSDAPSDGKLYARCNGAWVEITSGGQDEPDDPTPDPPATDTFRYGVVPYSVAGDITSVTQLTQAMLDASASTVTTATAQAAAGISLGTPSAGDWLFVLLPADSALAAAKFDGVSDYVPFGTGVPVADTEANGSTVTIGGTAFKIYGEWAAVSAEYLFRLA